MWGVHRWFRQRWDNYRGKSIQQGCKTVLIDWWCPVWCNWAVCLWPPIHVDCRADGYYFAENCGEHEHQRTTWLFMRSVWPRRKPRCKRAPLAGPFRQHVGRSAVLSAPIRWKLERKWSYPRKPPFSRRNTPAWHDSHHTGFRKWKSSVLRCLKRSSCGYRRNLAGLDAEFLKVYWGRRRCIYGVQAGARR